MFVFRWLLCEDSLSLPTRGKCFILVGSFMFLLGVLLSMPKETFSQKVHCISLQDVEKNHILEVLEMTCWRIRGKSGAAEILGLKPTTLESKMSKLNISRN